MEIDFFSSSPPGRSHSTLRYILINNFKIHAGREGRGAGARDKLALPPDHFPELTHTAAEHTDNEIDQRIYQGES